MNLAEIKAAAEAALRRKTKHGALISEGEALALALHSLWLVERVEELAEALRFICTTNDSGPRIETYRTAGGGYEGLQAVAEAALARLEET